MTTIPSPWRDHRAHPDAAARALITLTWSQFAGDRFQTLVTSLHGSTRR